MKRLILAGLSTLALFIIASPVPALNHRTSDATPMLNKLSDRFDDDHVDTVNRLVDRFNGFYEETLTR